MGDGGQGFAGDRRRRRELFQAGAEVIVEGQQDAAGVFQADTLLTKCASKYEEMPKDHPKVGQNAATGPDAAAGGAL